MEVILAIDPNGGMGVKDRLPWYIPEDLELFKKKTLGRTLLMGRKTIQTLPTLKNRNIICMSRDFLDTRSWLNDVEFCWKPFETIAVEFPDIMIAGGREIYKLAFSYPNLIYRVHLSIMKRVYDCDTYFDKDWLSNFVIIDSQEYEDFTHYVLEYNSSGYGEQQYLDLIQHILSSGSSKEGRNGKTLSLFKNDMKFDLRDGFPLLTTKKMFLRGILEEFIFFLNGKTDSSELSRKKVHIWEGNTTKEFIASRNLQYAEGVLGPLYGYQWRFFNAPYHIDNHGRPTPAQGGVDQLANVINLIRTDPNSRRILLTAYNPSQAEEGVLYPCHSITIQFYVDNEHLDMFCYNRSQDSICGIPFNIASSSLLLMIVAKLTDKIPRFFHMTMGDSHIYEEHIDVAQEQVKRVPYKFPSLKIPEIQTLNDLSKLQANQFELENYRCHSALKAKMIA